MYSSCVPPLYLLKYAVVKKNQVIIALKRLAFSGQLIWADSFDREWTFILDRGRTIYATSNHCSINRWRRWVHHFYPTFDLHLHCLEDELAEGDRIENWNCWEYELLRTWMNQGKISHHNMSCIIQAIFEELLFDLVQAGNTTHKLERSHPINLPPPIPGINDEAAFKSVQREWQEWVDAELYSYAANLAPIIKQQQQLYEATSPAVYEMLTTLLDGENTLRDLAIKTQRNLLEVGQALQPYLQLGWIKLVAPFEPPIPNPRFKPKVTVIKSATVLTVACIDDSPLICQTLGAVVQAAGYRFIGITEAPRAIATLLAKKPDLIFLDLVMPETNGYEICSQLRKVSLFRETPIIILTGNDGIVDQVRARLLGASDFLSKPMEPAVILSTIHKHLQHCSVK